jgi:prepilin-type N-terminal cleavage/methylation domain-containing protein
MKTFRRSKSRPGFTLVELLVAMAMGLIVLTVMFTMFRTSQRSYTLQDYVAEMQQNLRVAMYSVTRDLRMAGCGVNLLNQLVPTVEVFDGENSTWKNLQGITATNSTTGPDQIDLFIGDIQSGEYDATIRENMPDASADLKVDTTANFQIGDMVIISNGINAALFVVSLPQPAALAIQHRPAISIFNPPAAFKNFPHGGGYAQGSRLYNFGNGRWVTYYIDTTDPDHPKLMADFHDTNPDVVVADNIEDMQFHYFMADGSDTDNPAGDEDNVRAIRVTFSARTDAVDRDAATVFRPVTIEDHVIGAVSPDGYRRRLLSTVIKVRNAGT